MKHTFITENHLQHGDKIARDSLCVFRSGEAFLMRGKTSFRMSVSGCLRIQHINNDATAELQIVKTGEAAVRGTMEPVSKSKSIRVCVMVLTLLVEEPVPIWCSWSLRR